MTEWRRSWGAAVLNFLGFGLLVVLLLYGTVLVQKVDDQNKQLAADGQFRNHLLALVLADQAQLSKLVADDVAGQKAAALGGVAVAKVIAGLEQSLNALCRIEGCGLPPLSANLLTPTPRPTTPTTVSRPKVGAAAANTKPRAHRHRKQKP